MAILSNKSGIQFSGQYYEVGDEIPFAIVGKQLAQLRAAGRVRTDDLSERRAYTSGSRFKRYSPPVEPPNGNGNGNGNGGE